MGRTPFRVAPRSLFVAAAAALFVLNALGWVLYGRSTAPVHGREAAPEVAAAPPRVTLRAALPTQKVDGADRLIVVLDLGPDDGSAHGASADTRPEILEPPFTVEPQLAGTWEWEGADRLVYLLDEPIGPCRTLRMTPTAALERYLGRAVDPEFEARWTTAPLRPKRLRILGVTDEKVMAEVWLNAELTREDVLAALEVRIPEGEEALALTLSDVAAPALGSGRRGGLRGRATSTSFPYRFEFPRPARDVQHVQVRLDHPWVHLGAEEAAAPRGWLLEIPGRFALTDKDADVSNDRNSASITLEGAFEAGESYTVALPENLLASNGETLLASSQFDVTIPERQPALHLPHWRGTLSPQGHLTLELKSTAVDAVRVTAEKVLPNNLVEHVRGGSRDFTSSKVLAETFPLPPATDGTPVSRHALDLRSLLQDGDGPIEGIYHLRVQSTENRWTQDYATVRITDLGTTVKRDADGLHVWVRSIATGAPMEGALLTALSVKDQTLGQGRSNADGYGLIQCPREHRPSDAADTAPFLVLVEHGSDMAYAELESSRWDVPLSVAQGRQLPGAADVFAYTERSLYRPGDSVFITGIARTPKGIVFARPLALSITRPDGAVMHEETVTPDPGQGLFHASFSTSENARTGTWKVTLRDPDTGEQAGRARFGVEAFLPARMALTSESSFAPVDGAQAPVTSVTARSLAGTSMEGFGADVATRWTPLKYRSTRFPLFSFQRADDERYGQHASGEAQLDEHGVARVDVPGFGSIASDARGLWRASSTWTVTEPGSRSAVAHSTTRVDTALEHRGLRVDQVPGFAADADASVTGAGAHVVQVGEPFTALAVCLDAEDRMAAADARALFLTLDRIDKRWEMDHGGGNSRWVRRTTVTPIAQEAMVADKAGLYRFVGTCPSEGEYRLTLRGQDDVPPMTLSFHGSDHPSSFRPALESESVRLTVDSPSAVPGSKVTLTIDSPFDGTALVTAEDDRLRWQQQVTIENGRATLNVLVPSDVRGGLVLSCQVTRPLDARAETWRPHRAYGWARIETVHSPHQLDVNIEAPERVRPGDITKVTVRATDLGLSGESAGRAAVHLWAVDEGLRIAGGHSRPQPFSHFMAPRAFNGSATDSWFTLLPDLNLPGVVSRIGGDAGLAREARRRAPERVHVVPGVLWNEAVLLGDDGSAHFELRVPDFTGELTWMAVVVDRDEYGSAEASTTLAGELPLALGLPRFVAPGDQFELKVAFENATEESATVVPRLELSRAGAIREATGADEVTLAAGERHVAWFVVEAVDRGRITGEAWLDGTFETGRAVAERSAIDLPVRSGSPLIVASHTLSFDATAGLDASLHLGDLLGLDATSREECELRLSASPGLDLLPAGAYLTDYPHGCAEQTASRVFASLSLFGLRAKGDDSDTALREVDDRVVRGFVRLTGMQTDDGGIGYWPGHSSSSDWASLYVAEVIAAAQELGFAAPPRLAQGLRRYIDGRLRAASSQDERAKLLFAAAALGSRHDGWMRRLEEQREDLSGSARASLAAALGAVGETDRALSVLSAGEAAGTQPSGRPGRGYLDSSTRTTALELRTLLRIDPHHPGVMGRVERLQAERSSASGRWRNTVDNAAALAALAAYAQSLPAEQADWTVELGLGLDAVTATSDQVTDSEWASAIPAGMDTLDLAVQGTGPVFLSLRGTGRAGQGVGEVDRGLTCRRNLYDGSGALLDAEAIGHGDLVFVEIELSTDGRSAVHDVAIVDPLPGGLEIETPKLLGRFPWQESAGLREPTPSFIRAGSADRVEFLDDRVLIYGTAAPQPVVFRYAARAVAAGTYEWSPVQAEAMYDPEVSSLGQATLLTRIAR